MCQPVALRLRGTFIDFEPCQSPQDNLGHGPRRRSFSCPPGSHVLAEAAEAKQNTDRHYLNDLVSRVTKLSAKDHEADDSKFLQELENNLGTKTAENEENRKVRLDKLVAMSDIKQVSRCANQPKRLRATKPQPSGSAHPSPSHKGHGSLSGQDLTTLMIRNIPCKFKLKDMMDLLNSLGFAGKYDFLHLPGRGKQFSNLGYAFINLESSASVPEFFAKLNGVAFSRLVGINSDKVIDIRPARAQGFAENMAKIGPFDPHSDDVSLFWKQA